MPRLCPVSLAAALLSLPAAPAADAPVSFLRDVAPVLQENCLACHDAKKRAGKYDLSTPERLFAGGNGGEPITPGKPDESDFYTLLVTNEPRRMPPRDKGEAVPAAGAELVRRWIAQGAKLDAGLNPKAELVQELRARWSPPAPPERYSTPPVVNAVAFTPDGKQLVVGGHHELTVWSLPDGKLARRIRTRAERAYALLFLPDGRLAVAGGRPGQEGDVVLYALPAPGVGPAALDGVSDPKVRLAKLFEGDDSQLALAASPDGTRLAAGGCDRVIRVWNLGGKNAKPEQTAETHTDWVLGLAFSPDGKKLASASRDKTAKVWDLEARESLLTFPDHQNSVAGVAFMPDGEQCLSIGADSQVRLWKTGGEGKPQVKNAGGHADELFQLARPGSGAFLATASADRTVRLWETPKLQQKRELRGFTDYVYAVAVSPDGSLVAGGSYAGEVKVWGADDGKAIAEFVAAPGWEPPAR